MGFLAKLLQAIGYVPMIVTGIENFFGTRTGQEKKDAALTFLEAAISMGEAISARQIVNEPQFRDGLGKIIDGAVACLNASVWAKAKG